MSIAGIAASSFFSGAIQHNVHGRLQSAQQEFQKLGQDLQSGNLAQAQADFANLLALPATPGGTSQPSATTPFSQSLRGVAHDLVQGTPSDAKTSPANHIHSNPFSDGPQSFHFRHRSDGGPGPASQGGASAAGSSEVISQALGALGQELQSGNLASAQQSYASLLQDFQHLGGIGATAGAVSVSA